MDKNHDLFVVEVNASPMLVGTSHTKTKLMKKLSSDIFKIQLSFLRSRVKRTIQVVKENLDDIRKG
jgi:hypothetical protein